MSYIDFDINLRSEEERTTLPLLHPRFLNSGTHVRPHAHTEKVVVLCSSCIGRWLEDVPVTVVMAVEIYSGDEKPRGGSGSDGGRRVNEVRGEGRD